MTFDAIQTGPKGRTVELYEFSQVGTFTRVTSAATTQNIAGVDYVPLEGLNRGRPVQGNETTSGDLKIEVPDTFSIAQQFRGTIPSSFPQLTIFKKHLNDADDDVYTYWKGDIVNCAFDDRNRTATLVGRAATRVFERPIPRAVFSGLCNNQLFDGGCQVVRASFQGLVTVFSIDSTGTTLVLTGLRTLADTLHTASGGSLTAQEIDDYWQRGIITTQNSPTEKRMIVETDIGGDPDQVRISLPFRELNVGDSIEVAAGCPHSLDFCNRKFGNVENYGGFPYVPSEGRNPFNIELDSGRARDGGLVSRIAGIIAGSS